MKYAYNCSEMIVRSRTLVAILIGVVEGVLGFARRVPDSPITTTLPLVQIQRLVGDQYAGFRQSCLLLYADGRYHREVRQQETGNPIITRWQSPEVFEGRVPADELQEFKEVVDTSVFRAIDGTIGDLRGLPSKMVLGPHGFTPHEDIAVLLASVTRTGHPQVFEVFLGRRDLKNPLKSFLQLVQEAEKRTDRQLGVSAATNCSISTSSPGAPLADPITNMIPTAIYTPLPDSSINKATVKRSRKVLLEAIINADGSVGPTSVKRGIDPALDKEAQETVSKWRFSPARLYGMPLAVPMRIEVSFPSP